VCVCIYKSSDGNQGHVDAANVGFDNPSAQYRRQYNNNNNTRKTFLHGERVGGVRVTKPNNNCRKDELQTRR